MDNSREKEKRVAALGRTEDRPIWGLWFSILVRSIHQLGAALVLAAVFFLEGIPGFSLWFAVVSGVLLLLAEAARHRQIHREVSGAATFVKCGLIGLAIHGVLSLSIGVTAGFLIASVAAHAPKNVRHKLLY